MSLKYLSLALIAVASASPLDTLSKATSDDPFKPCKPQGATGTTPPAVGTDLSSLYTNILASVQGVDSGKRSINARGETDFSCRESLACVNVQNINVPMCWDKFTTNFLFPDGSYGSVTSGEFHSGGSVVNLLTGDYSKAGESANIYAKDPQEKPNTATISLPAQFTGTGVGEAIPATELGSIIVYTTTIPEQIYSAPTTVAETIEVATVSGLKVSTTVPATTVTHATTIAAHTSVVTQTGAVESTAATAAPTPSTGAAGHLAVGSMKSVEMFMFGALLYAVYAL